MVHLHDTLPPALQLAHKNREEMEAVPIKVSQFSRANP